MHLCMIENQYKRRSKFTLTSNFKAPNTVPQMRGSTIASIQRDSQLSLYKYILIVIHVGGTKAHLH